MNDTTQFSDDPRLTAYALGELDATERAEVEALIAANPAARSVVEEIRATAAQLESALAHESAAETVPAVRDPYARDKSPRVLRFPQVYYVIGGLAAACFAVVAVLYEPPPRPAHASQKMSLPVAANLPVVTTAPDDAESTAAPGLVAQVLSEQMDKKMAAMQFQVESLDAAREQAQARRERDVRLAAQSAARFVSGGGATAAALRANYFPAPELSTEAYSYRAESEFLRTRDHPLSTFSADVDTASYANVRRMLLAGRRPPVDAVRIEELLNYFPYRYAPPRDGAPFAASMEVAEAPWAPAHRLVRIGLKAREVAAGERGVANLVFLLDVSGSMNAPNKLPLVKESLRLLLARLRTDDRVAIVTYAGACGLALPSTPAAKAREIEAALDQLRPEGSTNGAMGLQLAYDIAKANFVSGGVNRVILCTDGDFNVGVTSEGELTRLIQEKAKSGVFLTVLGFGMGNLKDATLQQLADRGNGSYGYVDTRREAEKLLVEQVSGTLVTVAQDVKLQVEFNPARVAAYRLIGYEKRRLQKEDFNNDAVDAGEIGAGHTVTALYELVPAGGDDSGETGTVEPLKYATVPASAETAARADFADELLTLKIRYKEPGAAQSRRLEFPLVDRGGRFADASDDFKFAAAVAGFGLLLRDSPHQGAATFALVQQWAEAGLAQDAGGYRAEFVDLVRRAQALQ